MEVHQSDCYPDRAAGQILQGRRLSPGLFPQEPQCPLLRGCDPAEAGKAQTETRETLTVPSPASVWRVRRLDGALARGPGGGTAHVRGQKRRHDAKGAAALWTAGTRPRFACTLV